MTDEEIFNECRHLSIMGIKLRSLIQAARSCVNVAGDVVEVGVYRGGSGLALCRVFAEKKVFLIDTFTGIPENDSIEGGHEKGDFACDDMSVRSMLDSHKVNNATILAIDVRKIGEFGLPLSFIHLDADIEQSTTAAVELLVPRLSPGGGIFFDDYSNDRCRGVKLAVDKLMATDNFTLVVERGTAFLQLK